MHENPEVDRTHTGSFCALARVLQWMIRMNQVAHPAQGSPALSGVETLGRAAAPTPSRLARRRGHLSTRRLLAALGAVAIAAAAIVLGHRAFTRPTAVGVATVAVGTVREETIGPGTVQSRYSVSLGSRVAGTLDRVLADVGDEVKKGQLLATLDRTELEARFQSTRGAVASARQDVALARASLAKARSDLDLARIKDRRARSLVLPGAISAEEADEARGASLAADANQRAALAAVDVRQADLARAVQEQRVAETILSYTAIESPMAAVVTRRALEPGSAVAPGAIVFQIVDADALWVATFIDQSLAGRVLPGQPATIRLRSGADVPGRVARIALEADPVTRELEVDITFDVRPSRFAINEEADVTILGAQASGVAVPLAALSHGPDGVAVYVVEGGRAHRRHVRIGIEGAKRAQVLEGLHPGESVVLTPGAVRDGQRVTAAAGG
jgi:RND family efflux transporter MFP subunit